MDKLKNSILKVISGDSYPIDVHPVTKGDLKTITKNNGWLFIWTNEIKYSDWHVFKLTIRDNPNEIMPDVNLAGIKFR